MPAETYRTDCLSNLLESVAWTWRLSDLDPGNYPFIQPDSPFAWESYDGWIELDDGWLFNAC
jgi:hypothetical protein